jgi:hypothetical protein
MNLTLFEWILLQAMQSILQRHTVMLLAVVCVCLCVHWLRYWCVPLGGDVVAATVVKQGDKSAQQQSNTTMWDPKRLEQAIYSFLHPPLNRTDGNDRHKTEALCRTLLEVMLGMVLPKVRPKWLVNPTTKRCLELDMYNEEHKLAFEYDGAQHNVYTPHYHVNEHHFQYRKLLDQLKTELCREAGVLLIRIPWAEVSYSNEVRTARYLQQLLYTKGIPHQTIV